MASNFTTKIQNGLEKIKAIIRSIIKDEHNDVLSAHQGGFNHDLSLTYLGGSQAVEPKLIFNTTVDSPIHLGAIYFNNDSTTEGWIDFDKSYDSESNALMFQEITIHVDGHISADSELMALGYSFGNSARLSHEGRYIDVRNAVIQRAKVESVPTSDYDIVNKKYIDNATNTINNSLSEKASKIHEHTIDEITELEQKLSSKSDLGHTHTTTSLGAIGFPDLSKEIQVSSGYTVPENGWVWGFMTRNGYINIQRNGVIYNVAQQGEANQSTSGFIPVLKGDVVTAKLHSSTKLHFYPCIN